MKHLRPLFITLLISSQLLVSGCGPLIVASAAGTVAVIADRRTTGTIIEDNAIEIKAVNKLKSIEQLDDKSKIAITSYNERVLLTGQASDKTTRNKVLLAIKSIPKVRTIYNEIEISSPSSFKTSTYDTWLTTKVKAQLTNNPIVNPLNIKVTTENKTVYLMGLVTKQESDAATKIARRVTGVNKVVKLFEYIKNDSTNYQYAINQ